MSSFFSITTPVRYEGPNSRNPLAFKWYDAKKKVMGKPLSQHLRFAACYWHSFCWTGTDPFGGDTFLRPWQGGGDPMRQAKAKADVAFEMFRLLGVPFFAFHDRDIAPEGASLAESNRNVREIAEIFEKKMKATGVRLLWGTANLFSHRRYMAGAATNPDPDVFAYAAAQVKNAMDVTHALKGEGYVLWGGREGYETILNTDIGRELQQLGRFLNLVVEYKHKIGFNGAIFIEPKPKEPTKHQYDYDVGEHLRLPQEPRARQGDQASTSSRTMPSWPDTASSTRSRSPLRSASSGRSTSTAATTFSAGTPTSSP